MNKYVYDYEIKKTNIFEKFILFFKKGFYIKNDKNEPITTIKFKRAFGKTYNITQNINVKRGKKLEKENEN